jgi:hypothetical protein
MQRFKHGLHAALECSEVENGTAAPVEGDAAERLFAGGEIFPAAGKKAGKRKKMLEKLLWPTGSARSGAGRC